MISTLLLLLHTATLHSLFIILPSLVRMFNLSLLYVTVRHCFSLFFLYVTFDRNHELTSCRTYYGPYYSLASYINDDGTECIDMFFVFLKFTIMYVLMLF